MTAGLVSSQFLMYGAVKDGELKGIPYAIILQLMVVFQPLVLLRAWRSTRKTRDAFQ
jgi:hypothetical protein